ncbi:MAG: hypothetical protein QF441_03070 [Bacteriovoracaceae bacterium]|nr:hypothetical protein [Bacteriovoracaceae bacterium]
MSWFRCNYFFILILVLPSTIYAQRYTSQECLKANFVTSIENEERFFGLIRSVLTIKKEGCIIDVHYKNILETSWLIDICREPIHIKESRFGNQSVFKRVGVCEGAVETDYCSSWKELHKTLQDYGLIFAQGEREKLETAHGKVYCSYLLAKKYLGQGVLFSKYGKNINLFDDKEPSQKIHRSETSTPAPLQQKTKPESSELVGNTKPSTHEQDSIDFDQQKAQEESLTEIQEDKRF